MALFQQIMFGYCDIYFVLYKNIKSEMKTTQKIVSN